MTPQIYPILEKKYQDVFFLQQSLKIERQIINTICEYFSIDHLDILGQDRKRTLSLPRMLAMYFIRRKTKLTYREIGEIFNNRNHATIIYSLNTIADLMDVDKRIVVHVNAIEKLMELL